MKRLVLILLLASPLSAQDVKILFPMLSRGVVNGTGGSSFETILESYSPSSPFFVKTERVFPDRSSHGRFLFFPADAQFGYELMSHGAGIPDDITQLPVVRERDLRTGLSTIIGMHAEPNYIFDIQGPHLTGTWKQRNMLRIYDFDNTGRLEVDVVYRVAAFTTTFSGPHLVINRRDGDSESDPMFGEVLLDGPCVSSPASNICGSWTGIVVEIHPTDPTIRYFPMLSSTDNATQYVTIRVPQ